MNIALLGYGKMGKEIEQIAIARKHTITLKVDVTNYKTFDRNELKKCDAAIEFSTPDTAVENVLMCFEHNIPVVVGTTGWLHKVEEIKKMCEEKKQALLYSSNFSIGVNIFFKLNEYLAKIMNRYPEYNASMEEVHHVHKKDSPSGTAISLATQVIEHLKRKETWVNHDETKQTELAIISKRIDEVPGTHSIFYKSKVDDINITHVAHNRQGFALGAVVAAEWIKGKQGIFSMKDVLGDI